MQATTIMLMFQYAFKYLKNEIPHHNLHTLTMFILLTIILFYLVIYIQSKKVGKPTGYRTSLNDLHIHTEQLCRITMNTLLHTYIEK
jgi:preprotein translocase subunit SecY